MARSPVSRSTKISNAQVKKLTVVQEAEKIFIASATCFAKIKQLHKLINYKCGP